MTVRSASLVALIGPGCVALACAHPVDPSPLPDPLPAVEPEAELAVVEPVEELPDVMVEQVAEGELLGVPVVEELEVEVDGGPERVTLSATGADLRSVLVALAEAAGVDMIVGPAVQGRVTVHLDEVPAREALERVIHETGYMVARPLQAPWGPTVFYVVPVNVNEADLETIKGRFGVSDELARFLIRSRIPPN